jgi:soluble cytochrome b562
MFIRYAASLVIPLLVFLSSASLKAQAPGGAQPDIVLGMAELEMAYIPALALSNQGKLELTKKAVRRLQNEWNDFNAKFYSYFPYDMLWQSSFKGIGNIIGTAENLLAEGSLDKVHETLEQIRGIMMKLRAEHSISFYIDYLNYYHETMEHILGIAEGAAPSGLTERDITRISELQKTAYQQWESLKAAPFNPDHYAFDRKKLPALHEGIDAIGRSLTDLGSALQTGNKEAIIRASLALRPPYVKTNLLFGDFSHLQKNA